MTAFFLIAGMTMQRSFTASPLYIATGKNGCCSQAGKKRPTIREKTPSAQAWAGASPRLNDVSAKQPCGSGPQLDAQDNKPGSGPKPRPGHCRQARQEADPSCGLGAFACAACGFAVPCHVRRDPARHWQHFCSKRLRNSPVYARQTAFEKNTHIARQSKNTCRLFLRAKTIG